VRHFWVKNPLRFFPASGLFPFTFLLLPFYFILYPCLRQAAFFFFQIHGFVTIFDSKIPPKPDTLLTLIPALHAGLFMLNPSGVIFYFQN
jgi:hypothetical protein